MKLLLTGTAGFIGYSLTKKLLELNPDVQIVGLDNINDYYELSLKYGRLADLGFDKSDIVYGKKIVSSHSKNSFFIQLKLEDKAGIDRLFAEEKFDIVCNLAAQAGVRYSIENPYAYIESNIVGFINILEACRHNPVQHLVYASSSSVYGMNDKVPFSEEDKVDSPVSLYAASKKSNELMAHAYSNLYKIPATGLRFFTVYGPWGRPDMAPFLFTKAIVNNEPIKIFNNGNMLRDFTYIDDIVDGVIKTLTHIPQTEIPYKIYNIGNSKPIKLMDFISEIEQALNKEAQKVFMAMQPGDVYQTYADISNLENDVNFKPDTPIKKGVKSFVDWYISFYGITK
ncbi:NAD-dependent epimerase/dehydratase family protein [Dysgonomonas capnocytophagoides]|uniref:NAD-dependent epimerase/dehydratase family protein n=1 Tax=Dysgonomonas capnocytophagoides TaxID=45254 RepID=A0A4Y8KZM1_9BACT|nr:NAD-dependent epimerase/dehydratase family protein [Dysgonomonas capnocytophagoides]TFD93173.1 NAD-dependent epimerase/dehydratase family protein [Dysgonomonas capnocytophagoides]